MLSKICYLMSLIDNMSHGRISYWKNSNFEAERSSRLWLWFIFGRPGVGYAVHWSRSEREFPSLSSRAWLWQGLELAMISEILARIDSRWTISPILSDWRLPGRGLVWVEAAMIYRLFCLDCGIIHWQNMVGYGLSLGQCKGKSVNSRLAWSFLLEANNITIFDANLTGVHAEAHLEGIAQPKIETPGLNSSFRGRCRAQKQLQDTEDGVHRSLVRCSLSSADIVPEYIRKDGLSSSVWMVVFISNWRFGDLFLCYFRDFGRSRLNRCCHFTLVIRPQFAESFRLISLYHAGHSQFFWTLVHQTCSLILRLLCPVNGISRTKILVMVNQIHITKDGGCQFCGSHFVNIFVLEGVKPPFCLELIWEWNGFLSSWKKDRPSKVHRLHLKSFVTDRIPSLQFVRVIFLSEMITDSSSES
jgi:hypothetical protein